MTRAGVALLATIPAVSAGLIGCGGAPETARFAVRDSAGVTIVESRAPRWQDGEGWRVDSTPFFDVGSLDGGAAYEFDVVEDAMRLADGSVVVADFGSRQIRQFGAGGQIQWVSGREGDGPGEYNRIRNINRYRGDSILVYDFWLGRATVLDRDGQVGRVFRLESTGRSDRIYPLSDSTLAAVFLGIEALERGFEGGGGLIRIPEPLVRVRPDGTVIDTITVVPGGESFMVPEAEVRPLFGRRGAPVAVAGSEVYSGTADRMSFQVHAESGRLLRSIRVPGFDLTVSPAQVAAERATRLRDNSPDWLRSAVAALPSPPARPAYARLLVDPRGTVWLEPYRGNSERDVTMPWQVFGPDGEWLGAVFMPQSLRVFEIGLEHMLGVRLGEDQVEHVQMFGLHRN